MQAENKTRKIGMWTASAFVIANMIGTGVFTSLGFQLLGTHQMGAVMMLWLFGGVVALCGALTYAELGSAMPRSGGEYHYLGEIYHPSVGFCVGLDFAYRRFCSSRGAHLHGFVVLCLPHFPCLEPEMDSLGCPDLDYLDAHPRLEVQRLVPEHLHGVENHRDHHLHRLRFHLA